VEESHKAKMVWAATPNNGCSTGEPQAAQFLFFLGGFFFSFIKKRKKSRNPSTLRIMCDAQPSELSRDRK